MPQYIVRPSFVSGVPLDATKIIDLGRSFHATDVPPFFHTPLFLRAPEIIFKDKVDLRMDLWSMGCMVRFRRYTCDRTDEYDRSSNLSPADRRSTV
jgi:serine/threonine-protein kinase SRPK3